MKQVEVPDADYFQKTEDSFLFTYLFNGNKRFLTLEERHHVGDFLLDNGIIDNYTGFCRNTRFFRNEIALGRDSSDQIVQWQVNTEIAWASLQFTQEQTRFFAAKNELEKIGGVIGYGKAKVMKLFTYNHEKRA